MKNAFDRQKHQRCLTTLLANIIKTLSEKVAFKGGTCAFIFYDLPRFSFDLDFDLLSPLNQGEKDKIREILENHGAILDANDKRYTLFYLFDYGKGIKKIKIEFNKRIWINNKYKREWFLGLPILISDEATLLTNKLVALTDRKIAVARDLFDVCFFLEKGFPINENLIKERTNKDAQEYCKFLVEFIQEKFTSRNVLQGLGEALDNQQKIWVRTQLIDQTLAEIKELLFHFKPL